MIGCQAIDIKVVWGGVAARKVYISYILMSNFDFTGNMSASLSSDKLGVTTTVKEQVENIEVVRFLSRGLLCILRAVLTCRRSSRANCKCN
jgi:hypothetical protein